MAERPMGTVTFLFADLEGSTRLWEEHPEAMKAALSRHDDILRAAVETNRGHVVKSTGDGCLAAFTTAVDALVAAVDAQCTLNAEPWGATGPLRVRMGVNTGEAELRDSDYYGPAVNRAARLTAAAHGGQIVVSHATEGIVRDNLSRGIELEDIGEHRLRDLSRSERAFQVVHAKLQQEFPPLQSLDALPGNLPVQVTSFVGRERDLERIAGALRDSAVVTLTGVGGVGKTRLALQVAAEVVPTYRHGAWVCELAAVRDPEAVPDAVLATFGLQPRDGKSAAELLVEFLRNKELLVLLDNCEHLLRAVAELVSEIVHASLGVRVLATSREGLDVPGEQILVASSLGLPGPDASFEEVERCEAVRLFVERAHAVKVDFALDPANVDAVAQICRRLDGIALAIELAAARVAMLSPTELARRLDQRFRLLGGARRGAVERHQTLRAAIDWSYELLSEDEQCLLGRLSVFVGTFPFEGAEAVTAGGAIEIEDVFELLAALVARYLVVADTEPAETRYSLLETIRQYAQERLDDADDTDRVRAAHAAYYADLAETIYAQIDGPEGIEWAQRFQREVENFGAALAWTIDARDVDTALRLLSGALPQGPMDTAPIRRHAETVAAMPESVDNPRLPVALRLAAMNAHYEGDQALAARLCDDALAAEQRLGVTPAVPTLVSRSLIAQSQRDLGDAIEFAQRALSLARARGERPRVAVSLAMSAIAKTLVQDDASVAEAGAEAEEAIAIARSLDGPIPTAGILSLTGFVLGQTQPERALAYVDEAMAVWHQVGTRTPGIWAIAADIASRHGNRRSAIEFYAKSIEELHWFGYRPVLASSLTRLGTLLADDDPDAAAVLHGAGHAIAPNYIIAPYVAEAQEHANAAINASLGEERRLELNARGAAMADDDVVAYASVAIERALARIDGPPAAPASPTAAAAADSEHVFRRDGATWTIAYAGSRVQLRDAKGLRYIARLLAEPGREVHVADLAADNTGGEQPPRAGPAGAILDSTAIRAYRDRLAELEADVAEATEWNDPERAARAQEEMAAITAQLAGAYGLGGRSRTVADPTERVRKAVTNRIKDSLTRIADAHPALGRHLTNAVHTGAFCSYVPERPTPGSISTTAGRPRAERSGPLNCGFDGGGGGI
jgi:predicted ATPase/class 3 adenylate cyclase